MSNETTKHTKDELIAIAVGAIEDDQSMDKDDARAVLEILEEGAGESVYSDMEDACATAHETHAAILAGTYEGDEDADDIREQDVAMYALDKMAEAVVDILNGYNVTVEYGGKIEVSTPGGRRSWKSMTVDTAEEVAKEMLEQYTDDMDDATAAKLWRDGTTKEEWVEQALSVDGYAHSIGSYDGNATEFNNGGTLWTWFREN